MKTTTNKKMKAIVERAMGPAEYLKRPYGRTVVPEPDGTFRAEIIEFPGCIATGDTASEALANLEDVAASWLEATIAKGQRVPEPVENAPFSGKLVLRMPKSLHRKAAHLAAREGISLNQFIVTSVAEQVGGARSRPTSGAVQTWVGGQTVPKFYVQVGLFSAFAGGGTVPQSSGQYAMYQITRQMMLTPERPNAGS
jgi:predicted RNase H-like HicB family nuclease